MNYTREGDWGGEGESTDKRCVPRSSMPVSEEQPRRKE